ncbi:EamA family transporter RarD [Tropicimonas sediminicola]|uniref:Chloramphenicol-sensitive protein RarD n=1 Tax=Tropicimonas sediminicola TaxID=1031541 RepID=A0A239D937_9RHOB|nr:EamA family transporter RarD [Tropicimonas sediminicola]SNS28819.1 chloramphenicol-sensitive protein RarD [Tropicimonas sediminicola]
MTDAHNGILAMIGACVIWGLSPLLFKALGHVAPLEILAHRTIWAFVFFCAVLAVQGRLRLMPQLIGGAPGRVLFAALMISLNWLVYIWAVQIGRTMQASLGYYIFPLVTVLLGAVVFGERLGRVQWLSVGLAASAVCVLSFGFGVVPLVSLVLAVTFGLYGTLKKGLDAGPVVSVTAEVAMLLPLALGWLAWLYRDAGGFPHSLGTAGLFFLSGSLFTAIPLMLFSYATRRVRLVTVGLVQYLNPTLQFLCATLVFAEPFTGWHAAAFGLIWIALALYSGQAVMEERASRRRAMSVGTSGTV